MFSARGARVSPSDARGASKPPRQLLWCLRFLGGLEEEAMASIRRWVDEGEPRLPVRSAFPMASWIASIVTTFFRIKRATKFSE